MSPVTSKPATPRCFIHISFLDIGKSLFNFFVSAGSCSLHHPVGSFFNQVASNLNRFLRSIANVSFRKSTI